MGFFDFIRDLPGYKDAKAQGIHRLNKRHAFLIEPFRKELEGARVLDLGSHDGRWPYALAAAGAAHVVGVEGRADIVAQFADFPDTPHKQRVELRVGDLFEALEGEAAEGVRYDVVAVFGVFYHVMDHLRLLRLVQALGPRLVLIDSDFVTERAPLIWLTTERTGGKLNAIATAEGQERALVGTPSFRAMEMMAEALDYDLAWLDWQQVPKGERVGLRDYYNARKRGRSVRRATCALRPRG